MTAAEEPSIPVGTSASTENSLAAEGDVKPETVTVTATRVSQPAFEVPASIDVIGGESFNEDTWA